MDLENRRTALFFVDARVDQAIGLSRREFGVARRNIIAAQRLGAADQAQQQMHRRERIETYTY
jgi:hypothetical protein